MDHQSALAAPCAVPLSARLHTAPTILRLPRRRRRPEPAADAPPALPVILPFARPMPPHDEGVSFKSYVPARWNIWRYRDAQAGQLAAHVAPDSVYVPCAAGGAWVIFADGD